MNDNEIHCDDDDFDIWMCCAPRDHLHHHPKNRRWVQQWSVHYCWCCPTKKKDRPIRQFQWQHQ
jgi:hypothetical protein